MKVIFNQASSEMWLILPLEKAAMEKPVEKEKGRLHESVKGKNEYGEKNRFLVLQKSYAFLCKLFFLSYDFFIPTLFRLLYRSEWSFFKAPSFLPIIIFSFQLGIYFPSTFTTFFPGLCITFFLVYLSVFPVPLAWSTEVYLFVTAFLLRLFLEFHLFMR